MTENQEKNIRFVGDKNQRDEAIDFIDKKLKQNGVFRDDGDFSGGLNSIADEYMVLINDDDDCYTITAEPVSNDKEEMTLSIDKKTGTIYKNIARPGIHRIDDEDIDFLDEV